MEANKIKMLIEMEADDSNMFKMSQEIDPLYLSTRMKNDLVYCQMVLANFLAMHQQISSGTSQSEKQSYSARQSLHQIEQEMIAIGNEQSVLFDDLRLKIDRYLLEKDSGETAKLNRKEITDWVTQEFRKYSELHGEDIEPMQVERRLNKQELAVHFLLNFDPMCESSATSDEGFNEQLKGDEDSDETMQYSNGYIDDDDDLIDTSPTADYSYEDNDEEETYFVEDEFSDITDVIECLSSSSESTYIEELNKDIQCPPIDNNATQQHKQESLLKPQAERLSLPKEESHTAHGNEISEKANEIDVLENSRLKLKAALNKAKCRKSTNAADTATAAIPSPSTSTLSSLSSLSGKSDKTHKTPSPDFKITAASKSKSSSSLSLRSLRSSRSLKSRSNSRSPTSSLDNFEYPELPAEEKEPTELSQEPFLRLFGLYTHDYSNQLKTRRLERKRRNCTSTERGDFVYGQLELFERQYTKRGKREFLYSPPATRAVAKKRRYYGHGSAVAAAEQAAAAESAAAAKAFREKMLKSGLSVNGNEDKVCMVCFQRGPAVKCATCQGVYHIACHKANSDAPTKVRERTCPFCIRQTSKALKSKQ